MTNQTKSKVLKASATGICVLSPLIATITQFPIWVEQSSNATMSGTFLLLAFFSCLPFIRQIKEFFKSPSIPVLWVIFTILLILMENIIDQMIIVCIVGTIANVVGAVLFRIANNIKE